jgi:predicted transcriptional regulator
LLLEESPTDMASIDSAVAPQQPDAPAPPTAATVMNRNVRTCSPFSTVTEAVLIFKAEDCGMVPIVDQGKPVGVLTDRDIALGLAERPDIAQREVSEIMTKDVVSVPLDAPLNEVARVFGQKGVRRLLVVNPEGLLQGVISWSDIAPYLPSTWTGRMVSNVVEQPPTDTGRA